ncbi:MAG: NTP transferase domain-containing protein, partial [Angustibacter sp.]
MTWTIILPVQHLDRAKSRLHGFDSLARAQLARAFAADVLRAVTACERVTRVIVTTPDEQVRAVASSFGAEVCRDPARGLNPAITRGLELVPAGRPVAVLLADLPSLRAED